MHNVSKANCNEHGALHAWKIESFHILWYYFYITNVYM